MKGTGFRQSMGLLHNWCGLVAGWIGFAIFLTGTLAVFDDELTRWSSPELAVSAPATDAQILRVLEQLDARSPGYWFASLPADRTPAMRAMWKDADGQLVRRQVDPAADRWFEPRSTGGGGFFTEFHYALHAGDTGTWIVALVSVAMLVAMVTGVVVHRRIFSDFFTFRPSAAAQRRWLDMHNLLAVLCLPFLLMIVYTGVTIKSKHYLPVPPGPRPAATSDAPAAAREVPRATRHPAVPRTLLAQAEAVLGRDRIAFITVHEQGDELRFVASRKFDDRLNLSTDSATFDRADGQLLATSQVDQPAYLTQRVFAGLHFGQYGGLAVRWLYFVLGLAGAIMIASGLVLFSIKRPGRWVAAASTTAVTGLVLACLAHLGASRWLPIGLADRPGAEVWLFFGTWLLAALHAFAVPWARAWRMQLGLAGVLGVALASSDAVAMGVAAPPFDGARLMVDVLLVVLACGLWWLGKRFDRMLQTTPRRRPPASRGGAVTP